jgi:hypothetical protein
VGVVLRGGLRMDGGDEAGVLRGRLPAARGFVVEYPVRAQLHCRGSPALAPADARTRATSATRLLRWTRSAARRAWQSAARRAPA